MRKFKAILFCLVAVFMVAGSFACRPPWFPPEPGALNTFPGTFWGDWIPFTDDRIPANQGGRAVFPPGTTLEIDFFNGGYGRGWIDAMANRFMSEYPTVQITLRARSSEFTSHEGHFRTTPQNQLSNIFIQHNIPWETLAHATVSSSDNRPLIVNLNELYDAPVYFHKNSSDAPILNGTTDDDAPIRYLDRVIPSSLNTVRLGNEQGTSDFWKVAQIQGAGGLSYNQTLFTRYGLQVPKTYTELLALCNEIVRLKGVGTIPANIHPFVWSTEAYLWDSVVFDWWVQMSGMDSWDDFMRFDPTNPWQFDPDEYSYHKDAWTLWYNLIAADGGYAMQDGNTTAGKEFSFPDSRGMGHHEFNAHFAAGLAFMRPAVAWAARETGQSALDEHGTLMGIMPTPYLDGVVITRDDGTDVELNSKRWPSDMVIEGTDHEHPLADKPIRVAYDLAGRDSIVVTTRGQNGVGTPPGTSTAAALEFLRWIAVEDNAWLMPQHADGLLMAFQYNFEWLRKTSGFHPAHPRNRNIDGTPGNPMNVLGISSLHPDGRLWNRDMFEILGNSLRFNNYPRNSQVAIGGIGLPAIYPEGNAYAEAQERFSWPLSFDENGRLTPCMFFNSAWQAVQRLDFYRDIDFSQPRP
jgi:hypothetical protein